MTPVADILHGCSFNPVFLSVAATMVAPSVELKTAMLLASGILLVTLFLGLWQWFDQNSRDPEPNDEDREFFRRQDRRCYAGVAVMVALAIAIPVEPLLFLLLSNSSILLSKSRGAAISVAIWMVVCVVIVALLVLALFDLLATRQYARRHRRALQRERSKLMLEMIHRSGSSDSGHGFSERKKDV